MGSSNRGNANLLLFLFSFHLALLPSVVQCMKWEVPPLRQECFYHHIVNGSTVLVQYQTLSGGSREIDMMVRVCCAAHIITTFQIYTFIYRFH
jgi:hypothetical protein